MIDKIKKIMFHVLDFIFLMLSYMLCDCLIDRFNLAIGIIVSLVLYLIVVFVLCKIFKISYKS